MTDAANPWAIWHIVLGGTNWVRDAAGEIMTWPTEREADAARAGMIEPRTEWSGPRGIYTVFELTPRRRKSMGVGSPTDLHDRWAQREAELAALDDADEVDAARAGDGTSSRVDLHGERLFREMSARYVPPGSRGSGNKGRRRRKPVGGRQPEAEPWA